MHNRPHTLVARLKMNKSHRGIPLLHKRMLERRLKGGDTDALMSV